MIKAPKSDPCLVQFYGDVSVFALRRKKKEDKIWRKMRNCPYGCGKECRRMLQIQKGD